MEDEQKYRLVEGRKPRQSSYVEKMTRAMAKAMHAGVATRSSQAAPLNDNQLDRRLNSSAHSCEAFSCFRMNVRIPLSYVRDVSQLVKVYSN